MGDGFSAVEVAQYSGEIASEQCGDSFSTVEVVQYSILPVKDIQTFIMT